MMSKYKRLVSISMAACLIGSTFYSFPANAKPAAWSVPDSRIARTVELTAPGQTGTGIVDQTAPELGLGQAPGTGQGDNAPGGGQVPKAPDSAQGVPGSETTQNEGPGEQTEQTASTAITAADTATVTPPQIQGEGAVLMDAATGNLLYEKNADTRFYPASITKLMTALLVLEHCNLDDTVTFSATATTNLEAGAVSLNITQGDKLTVRQSLHALLLKSANEVANGLAEHVAGSNAAFAKLMNDKARALGCTNTNFVNPHGLNDSNHYTTPHDMALIARAAFQNDTLRKIDTTLSYQLPATKKAAARTITMGHKMMYPTDSRYYPGIIGGKTGYTSLAGNTLVTGVEKDGVRLIAVVMKCKSTQYTDTKALLDYGFEKMTSGEAAASANCWRQDGTGWYFVKSDKSLASNEWMKIDDVNYWFDSNSYMATGWRQFADSAWYYFKSSGAMAVNCWAQDGGKWFYLGADGALVKNTTTPDGYRVDEKGIWVQ